MASYLNIIGRAPSRTGQHLHTNTSSDCDMTWKKKRNKDNSEQTYTKLNCNSVVVHRLIIMFYSFSMRQPCLRFSMQTAFLRKTERSNGMFSTTGVHTGVEALILAGGHVRASAADLAVHGALIACVCVCVCVCSVSNSFFITPRIGTRFVSVDR